jgi:hypothetical protein
MDVQHGDAGVVRRLAKARVGEQRVLHARAAETFDAMAGAGDQQHRRRIDRAVAYDIHRQRFAVAAEQRVHMAVHVEPGALGSGQKLGARLGVTLREVPRRRAAHRAAAGRASQASARRTHSVAPSGIRSSLKS